MANVILPRIGHSDHDIESQMKTIQQKKRKGPNVPPIASRLTKDRKQTLVILEDISKNNQTELTVSGLAKQGSLEELKNDRDEGGWANNLYPLLNPNSADKKRDSISMLTIKALGRQSECEGLSRYELFNHLDGVEAEEHNGSIDAELVQWDDFNNKVRLDENLNNLFTCKKVILKLEVAKLDYIPGIIAVPYYHCMRCWELWKKCQEVVEDCGEESNPVRGIPMALDENSLRLINDSNISYIQVRGQKPSYKINTYQEDQRRQTLMEAFDSISDMSDDKDDRSKDSLEMTRGIRKYGGANVGEMLSSFDQIHKSRSEITSSSESTVLKFLKSPSQEKNLNISMSSSDQCEERRAFESDGRNEEHANKKGKDGKVTSGKPQITIFDDKEEANIIDMKFAGNTVLSSEINKVESSNTMAEEVSHNGGTKKIVTTNLVLGGGSGVGETSYNLPSAKKKSPLDLVAATQSKNGALRKSSGKSSKAELNGVKRRSSKGRVLSLTSIALADEKANNGNLKSKYSGIGNGEQLSSQGSKQNGLRRLSRSSRGQGSSSFKTSESVTVNCNQMVYNFNDLDPDHLETFTNQSGNSNDMNGSGSLLNQMSRTKRGLRTGVNSAGPDDVLRRHNRGSCELPPIDHKRLSPTTPGSNDMLRSRSNKSGIYREYSGNLSIRKSRVSDTGIKVPEAQKDSEMYRRRATRLFSGSDKTKKSNMFGNPRLSPQLTQELMGKECISFIAPMRQYLTPSPVIPNMISIAELMCLNLMNFTSSFTFSFYDLPDQYRKQNDSSFSKGKGQKGGKKKK